MYRTQRKNWWGVLGLSSLACSTTGAIDYHAGAPEQALARFRTPACEFKTHIGVPSEEASFFLVDGRYSFAFLVVDSTASGSEVENYWKDESGHHFAVHDLRRAWEYTFPDERGHNGKAVFYKGSFSTISRDTASAKKAFALEGHPIGVCELEYVPLQSSVPTRGEPPEDHSPACVPGSTQGCVGAGACRGGQSCLPDGSGFSPCDCGTGSAAGSESPMSLDPDGEEQP